MTFNPITMTGNSMLAGDRAKVELANANLAAKEQLFGGHPIRALRTHFSGQMDAFKTHAAGMFGQKSFNDSIAYGGPQSAHHDAGLIPKP